MKYSALTIILLPAGLALAGEVVHRSTARNYCHLPCYNYQPVRISNPTEQASLSPIKIDLLTETPDGTLEPSGKRVKIFQMSQPMLVNNHCCLKKISVQIDNQGGYKINFDAKQDPSLIPDPALLPIFIRLKQNKFFVSFWGSSNFPLVDQPAVMELGKSKDFEVDLPPFWVQQAQTVEKRCVGQPLSLEIKENFYTIDRITVELRYE